MIYKHLSAFKHSQVLHTVIGSFDGVHWAHQQLIQQAVQMAQQNGESSLIFSFDPLPKEYFLKDQFKGSLLPIQQKRKLLETFNADYTVITDFELIKDYTEKQFIEILLSKTDKLKLYSGGDFRIGRQENDQDLFYQSPYVERIIFDDIIINQDICRSSHIRELLLEGEIMRANTLLNREYTIYSHTVPGAKIGRSINFPTINVLPTKQITPKFGVYFGEITIYQKTYPAAIYVGYRPTVHGKTLRIESHIIYEFPYETIPQDTPAEVSFIERISEEKSFKSLEELKEMLYTYKSVSLGLATERYKNKLDRLS